MTTKEKIRYIADLILGYSFLNLVEITTGDYIVEFSDDKYIRIRVSIDLQVSLVNINVQYDKGLYDLPVPDEYHTCSFNIDNTISEKDIEDSLCRNSYLKTLFREHKLNNLLE